MNILIIDGNEREASEKYIKLGMETQYEVYAKILRKISNNNINIKIIHPAIDKNYLPHGLNLDDFHGVAWTGSLLNIYDDNPAIIRQIELAKILMKKNNKIFGSCWGLQVLVTAAGGVVKKNSRGLEAVVARNIVLNDMGLQHPMYSKKRKKFDAFCWHYDEAITLPENTSILASNQKSNIQAISFRNENSKIWAVQYHPEFNPLWMSKLMSQREEILLKEGIFKDKKEFDSFKFCLSNEDLSTIQKEIYGISDDLINEELHSTELLNWINYIKD